MNILHPIDIPRPYGPRQTVSLRDFLLVGMLFTLAFDYRRAAGDGNGLVIVLSLANIGFAVALTWHQRYVNRKVLAWLTPLPVFILGASFAGIMRGQATFSVIAQAIPVCIFASAALACATYPRNVHDLNKLLTMIAFSGAASAIWKLFLTFSTTGITLETVRYQVLSGATALLFAYAVAAFLTGGRRLMWLCLALSLGVVFVSVTRTYILMFAVGGAVAVFALPLSKLKKVTARLLALTACAVVVLVILQALIPAVADRWVARIFTAESIGIDITALTRVAEINGQIERMKGDSAGLVFGFGLTEPTLWIGSQMDQVRMVLGQDAEASGSGYGHNFYVGTIFVGGLLFGIPLLTSLLGIPLMALFKSRRAISKGATVQDAFLPIFGLCSSSCYATFGAFAGTLGDRSISLYYGISFGLLLTYLFVADRWKRMPA